MKEDLYDYICGKYSYFSPEFLLKGIVCSTGGPQYSIKDSCYIPMAELYPDEINDDEPNINRKENMEMENNLEISKEQQIKEIQQEYENLVSELNQLRENIKEPANKNYDILTECGKIEVELISTKNEINKIKKDFTCLKNEYKEKIKKKELKLILMLLVIGAIIPTVLTTISLIFKNPYLINNPGLTCGYIIGMPMVFGAIEILAYFPFREKYLSKLEKKYMQTEEYQNYQKQLNEKTKIKEEIEQKLNLKEKELESGYKVVNEISSQINLTIQSIRKLKDQLTEIMLPNSKNIEIGYLSTNTTYQETNNLEQNKTTLSRKLTPTTPNKN